jgi:hypothetical protein
MPSRIGHTLKEIGLANLLWNKLEVLWYLYFTVLMNGTGRSQVDAIYRSHDTGNKKRSLIGSVASEVLKSDHPALEVVRALIGRTNDAASTRNALVHADFYISEEDGVVDIGISPGGDHAKKNRLAGQELSDELSKFISTLKALVSDLEDLLPTGPAMPPGIPGPLTTVQWVRLLENALASEGGPE